MSIDVSQVEILLEDPDMILNPGQTLNGGFRVNTMIGVPVKRAEVSVLWYTMGKGDTDEGVIHCQSFAEDGMLDAQTAFPFSVVLPDAPWSYDGKIVKIRWAVRVRIYPKEGKEVAAEQNFRLWPAHRKQGEDA